jgi:16S rRNA (guanine966-N2)-methyltransferase
MRIIGGALAGRRIDAPSGQATRPTSDRVREALFNRIAHAAFADVLGEGANPLSGPVLDLYAGAGGLGLEALSRGASACDFVDSATPACAALRRNLVALDLTERATVSHSTVESFLRRARGSYQLVFADPPYADAGAPLDRALGLLVERRLLAPHALVVVEHGDHSVPRAASGGQPGLALIDQRRYGQTQLTFLGCIGQEGHAMAGGA